MKDRVLIRFDTIVAICALLASSENDNSADSLEIRVTNDGAGPALVRSAQLQIDGKPVSGWGDLFRLAISPSVKHAKARMQAGSVDATTTVRAGDTRVLFLLQSTNPRILSALRSHRISLTFCYCSINGRCWKESADEKTIGANLPQQVSHCDVGPSITAGSLQVH